MTKIDEIEAGQTQFDTVLAIRMPEAFKQLVNKAADDALMPAACWARQVLRQALKQREVA